jgi:hypothetical protein
LLAARLAECDEEALPRLGRSRDEDQVNLPEVRFGQIIRQVQVIDRSDSGLNRSRSAAARVPWADG